MKQNADEVASKNREEPRVKAAAYHRGSNSGLMSEVVKELSAVSEEDEEQNSDDDSVADLWDEIDNAVETELKKNPALTVRQILELEPRCGAMMLVDITALVNNIISAEASEELAEMVVEGADIDPMTRSASIQN